MEHKFKVGERVKYVLRGALAAFPYGSLGTVIEMRSGFSDKHSITVEMDDHPTHFHSGWVCDIHEFRKITPKTKKKGKKKWNNMRTK